MSFFSSKVWALDITRREDYSRRNTLWCKFHAKVKITWLFFIIFLQTDYAAGWRRRQTPRGRKDNRAFLLFRPQGGWRFAPQTCHSWRGAFGLPITTLTPPRKSPTAALNNCVSAGRPSARLPSPLPSYAPGVAFWRRLRVQSTRPPSPSRAANEITVELSGTGEPAPAIS